MAFNPLSRSRGRQVSAKSPDVGDSSQNDPTTNLLLGIILRDKIAREGESRQAQTTYDETMAREKAKRQTLIEGAYKALSYDLTQMRDLLLQVENPKMGIMNRIKGGLGLKVQQARGTPGGALLQRYSDVRNSALRNMGILRANETESRFSNSDAIRMERLFGDPIWSTELQEDLDFAENARNVDIKARDAGIQVPVSLFDRMFPNPEHQPRKYATKIMLGDVMRNPDTIQPEEVMGGFKYLVDNYGVKEIPKVMKESIAGYMKKRRIDF